MILDPYACISDAGFFSGRTDERTNKAILGVGFLEHYFSMTFFTTGQFSGKS